MEDRRLAAWCGIFSGIGLVVEAALFMGSGWSAPAFSTLDGAAAAMAGGGHLLRWAVVFGVFNLALLIVFLAGLANHLGGCQWRWKNQPRGGAKVCRFEDRDGVLGPVARLGTRAPRIAGVCQGALA
jgi:hypothetical protein